MIQKIYKQTFIKSFLFLSIVALGQVNAEVKEQIVVLQDQANFLDNEARERVAKLETFKKRYASEREVRDWAGWMKSVISGYFTDHIGPLARQLNILEDDFKKVETQKRMRNIQNRILGFQEIIIKVQSMSNLISDEFAAVLPPNVNKALGISGFAEERRKTFMNGYNSLQERLTRDYGRLGQPPEVKSYLDINFMFDEMIKDKLDEIIESMIRSLKNTKVAISEEWHANAARKDLATHIKILEDLAVKIEDSLDGGTLSEDLVEIKRLLILSSDAIYAFAGKSKGREGIYETLSISTSGLLMRYKNKFGAFQFGVASFKRRPSMSK